MPNPDAAGRTQLSTRCWRRALTRRAVGRGTSTCAGGGRSRAGPGDTAGRSSPRPTRSPSDPSPDGAQAQRRSTRRSTWRSTGRSTRRSTRRPTWRSTRQSTRWSTRRSTRRSTQRSTAQPAFKSCNLVYFFFLEYPFEIVITKCQSKVNLADFAK